jgi:hypothetical protein
LIPTGGPESIGLGLFGNFIEDSTGSGPEEAPARSGLKAAWADKDRAPPAPRGLCAPPGLRGFRDSDAVSLMLGVGGSFTFGDSPPIEALLVEESRLIS